MQDLRRAHNIALIGFMGTGKSTVAQALAGLLHFPVVDTDERIEALAQKRITDIFRDEGEAVFRQYERQVLAGLQNCRRTIIATGGGLAVQPGNLESLKTHALVVCLWASPQTIFERVRHQTHRPLLQTSDPLASIQQLLAQREPFYRQADVLVNTELRSIREIASQIAHHFRLFQNSPSLESSDSPASP